MFAVKGLGVPESQAGGMNLSVDHGPIPTYGAAKLDDMNG